MSISVGELNAQVGLQLAKLDAGLADMQAKFARNNDQLRRQSAKLKQEVQEQFDGYGQEIGDQIGHGLERSLGLHHAVKGLFMGLGFGSVEEAKEAIVGPWKEAAKLAEKIAELSERAVESQKRLTQFGLSDPDKLKLAQLDLKRSEAQYNKDANRDLIGEGSLAEEFDPTGILEENRINEHLVDLREEGNALDKQRLEVLELQKKVAEDTARADKERLAASKKELDDAMEKTNAAGEAMQKQREEVARAEAEQLRARQELLRQEEATQKRVTKDIERTVALYAKEMGRGNKEENELTKFGGTLDKKGEDRRIASAQVHAMERLTAVLEMLAAHGGMGAAG